MPGTWTKVCTVKVFIPFFRDPEDSEQARRAREKNKQIVYFHTHGAEAVTCTIFCDKGGRHSSNSLCQAEPKII